MLSPLRLLLIEDSPDDALLIVRALQNGGGYEVAWERVDTAAALSEVLERQPWDVITCDWAMPEFSAGAALKLLHERHVDVPIIIVSGQIGEEYAVTAMKSGAHDFVSKHKLARLCPAVERELRDAAERRERVGAEARLRETEAKYQGLVEQIPAITYTMALTEPFQLLYLSPQAESLVGASRAEWLEMMGWFRQVHADDRDRVLQGYAGCLDRREPLVIEYRLVTPTGAVRWFRDQSALVRDGDGNPLCLQGVLFDITDRKRAEDALQASEERFRVLVEQSSDVILLAAADTTVTYVSPSLAKVAGYAPADVVGQRGVELVHPADLEHVANRLSAAVERPGVAVDASCRIRHADGSWRWVEVVATNLLETPGIGAILTTMRDVSERKQTEDALRESEERIRLITDTIGEVFTLSDGDTGQVLYVSSGYERVWGRSRESLYQDPRSFVEAIHPEDRRRIRATRTEQPGQQPFDREYRIIRPDGSLRWIWARGFPVRDSAGKVARFVGIAQDITERKQADALLRERDEQLRLITENMLDMVSRITLDGIHEYVSPAHQRVLGYAPAEMLGKSVFAFMHPNDREWVIAAVTAGRKAGTAGRAEYRSRHADGHYVWLETIGKWLLDADGTPVGAVLSSRDVTERHAAASVLMERARLAALGADVGRALTARDALRPMLARCANAVVRHVDAALTRIWTINREDNVPELQASAGPAMHLDGADSRIPIGQQAIGLIASEREPLLTNHVIDDPRVGDQEWAAREGIVAFAGYPLIVDQQSVGVMALFARQPLTDLATAALAALANEIALGIQRKWTEDAMRILNEDLEHRIGERTAQLVAANKELEAFSYSVSHDLHAPLRSIDGFSQALLDDYAATLDETARRYVQRIRAGAQRMGDLIDDLMALSRVTQCELQFTSVDLTALATRVMARLRERDPHHAVDVRVAEPVTARGDTRLLRIVLENLLDNAWKYSHKQPAPRIEFGVREQAGSRTYFVRDNGAGFDMAGAAKLFDAFQRLHSADAFEGTGIGLATVQRIIHRHGGRIWAEAAIDAGATFSFTLGPPAAPARRRSTRARRSADAVSPTKRARRADR